MFDSEIDMTLTQRLAVFIIACLPSACWAESIARHCGIQGGLVVCIGCDDGQMGTSIATGDNYLVHGLDVDAQKVAKARRAVKTLGLYGRISVDTLRGGRLPYVDNLVNLVVSEDLGDVSMAEVMRVLRPGGVAYVKDGGDWKKTVKPWPGEIDEWTHFLHGPDNNAVARDSVVGVPRRMKWLGKPKFARAHEQVASLNTCVTTAGRLFYIVDDTPRADIRFPSRWTLIARDAFNGVVLWKRPVADWVDQLRRFRSGPAGMNFRMAAQDDRVYVTLGVDAPVSILDAATGKTLAVCRGTDGTRQVSLIDGKLAALVDTAPQTTAGEDARIRRGLKSPPGVRVIVVADAADGKTLWRKEIKEFVHPTLAARGDRLYYQSNAHLFCVEFGTGEPVWRAEAKMQLTGHEAGWESPTLVAGDAAVYCADFKRIVAFDVDDGTPLWNGPAKAGYNSPPDIFLIDGLLWMQRGGMVGLDPATGELKQEAPFTRGYMHHRCYRNKATERFFVRGDQGVQFVDRRSGDRSLHHWIRGTCQYGIMPANGLLYVTPDSCACNMKSRLAGFWALAPEADVADTAESKDVRLVHGPAFNEIANLKSQISNPTDWPVYRHDFARSGMTEAKVPAALSSAWRVKIGGRLSGVTAADGKAFVASVDAHTVHALDQRSGDTAWTFTAGARVDTPPTIYRGMALFGSADGWVYALRAADGELAWRFRAAPQQRLTFVNGQLESVWPVHGSVLVHDDTLVVTAGRSSYLDGGIRVYRLDPKTGRTRSQTTMYSPDPETGKQPKPLDGKDVQGAISDILLADGDDVYMRHVKLDFDSGNPTGKGLHVFSPIGLLDDTWWHRGYWVASDHFVAHWSGWWKAGNVVPSGRILAFDKKSIFGYGRDKYPGGNTGQWRGGEKYQLFACDWPSAKRGPRQKQPAPKGVENRWATQIPFYVRAMAVAGETMFIAGPPELTEAKGTGEKALALEDPREALATWNGKKGAKLWAVSTEDGKRLAAYEFDVPPVFDGMAAVEGRLLMSLGDGSVVCMEK